jgi:hypothetical protein
MPLQRIGLVDDFDIGHMANFLPGQVTNDVMVTNHPYEQHPRGELLSVELRKHSDVTA